jgi:hypothetical protein
LDHDHPAILDHPEHEQEEQRRYNGKLNHSGASSFSSV